MTKNEALKMALEALEADPLEMVADVDGHMVFLKDKAITAVKEALAQPKQEPLAWISTGPASMIHWTSDKPAYGDDWVPLYTAPPQRKPLTDEEIWKFWWSRPEVPEGEDDSMEEEFVAAVRAVLAAHGIFEQGDKND